MSKKRDPIEDLLEFLDHFEIRAVGRAKLAKFHLKFLDTREDNQWFRSLPYNIGIRDAVRWIKSRANDLKGSRLWTPRGWKQTLTDLVNKEQRPLIERIYRKAIQDWEQSDHQDLESLESLKYNEGILVGLDMSMRVLRGL